jgi:predicted RNA-binding Zn-ribbon protein involved in translation (DUF1610 family)
MSRRQDLMIQYQIAHEAHHLIRKAKARELIERELKTAHRTLVILSKWEREYDRKRFGDQKLGPCANCGHAMMLEEDAGAAECPNCGYVCDVAKVSFWCECPEQAPEQEHYYVGQGGTHGWLCSRCGGLRQTG